MSFNGAARSTDSLAVGRTCWSAGGAATPLPHSKVYKRGASMEIPAMQNVTSLELSRDCDAVQIPHGAAVTLPKGTPVDITQTLGGTFTVHAQGGLYRIAGKDADALGLEVPVEEKKASTGPVDIDEKEIWEILRTCYDPEIPVN